MAARWGAWMIVLLLLPTGLLPVPVLAGRGCCSYHGGVSGCAGRRLGCNDGQISPGCGCGGGGSSRRGSSSDDKSGSADEGGGNTSMPDPEHQQRAVETVKDLLGTPYKTGGSDSEGTDCSGLPNQAYP